LSASIRFTTEGCVKTQKGYSNLQVRYLSWSVKFFEFFCCYLSVLRLS
jgi:hypothetical protein